MYKDEIVRKCLKQFKNNLKTLTRLKLLKIIKELSDNKMVAYYHGYKITEKGKKLFKSHFQKIFMTYINKWIIKIFFFSNLNLFMPFS